MSLISEVKLTSNQMTHNGQILREYLDSNSVDTSSYFINVLDYGAVLDGITPNEEAVRSAIAASVASGSYRVYIPAGTCAVGAEIILPDNVHLCGAGRDVTVIKALDSMPKEQNVIRNSKWVYQVFGTDYNHGIIISDLTVDANHKGRDPGREWVDATLGNCILLATCRDCKIERVFATQGIQHCIDISAGYYFDNGNINDGPAGGSHNIIIQDTFASNASLDDCITTHNSSVISILNCHAWNDDPDMVWGNNQHGFEIDEGSKDVFVSNCRATNFITGFQQKGHDTTKPARNVTFDACIAEDCVNSFQIEHRNTNTIPSGQVQNARSSRIINCTSINANNSKYPSDHARAIRIDGFYGVYVQNFRVEGGAGNIYLTRGAAAVTLENLYFDGGYSGATDTVSEGLVHIETDSGCNNYRLINCTVQDAVSVPVLRDHTSSTPEGAPAVVVRTVSGIVANGSSASVPMISVVPDRGDNMQSLTPVGSWACAVRDAARGLGNGDYNNVSFSNGVATQVGSGTPNNGVVSGKAGSIYIDDGAGSVAGDMYISSDTGVNHWRRVAFS